MLDVLSAAPGAHGVTRPTAIAVTRKRSLTVLVTVEVNHKPSGVASPSSRSLEMNAVW